MNLINFFDFAGVLVFAISGIRLAARKEFDWFGALVIGYATALGGGTIRDILLGQPQIFWIKDTAYLYIILSALPITLVFNRYLVKFDIPFFIFDTMGIGFFTIIGLQKSILAGYSGIISVIMGVSTAVAGGIIRDILLNDIPLIFRNRAIYATACIVGALLFLLLEKTGLNSDLNMIVTIVVIISIRILSIRFNLKMPVIRLNEKQL